MLHKPQTQFLLPAGLLASNNIVSTLWVSAFYSVLYREKMCSIIQIILSCLIPCPEENPNLSQNKKTKPTITTETFFHSIISPLNMDSADAVGFGVQMKDSMTTTIAGLAHCVYCPVWMRKDQAVGIWVEIISCFFFSLPETQIKLIEEGQSAGLRTQTWLWHRPPLQMISRHDRPRSTLVYTTRMRSVNICGAVLEQSIMRLTKTCIMWWTTHH